jgi:L-asparaginase II
VPSAAPLARVIRSGLEESVHLGHVAVCDANGRLVAFAGDPDRITFARSCMKPLQAAVSLGAIDRSLTDRQIAIMCASHDGEPVHLRAVRSVLRVGGLDPTSLRTPPGRPLSGSAASRVRHPSSLHHDCSGKHAGMLAASAIRGWELETYRRPTHPIQRRVLAAVRTITDVDPTIGVDGCGVPVHGMPLRAIATLYARLPDERVPLTTRAIAAMRAEPQLVGGETRDDTAIMRATDDIVAKEGAEALYCAVSLDAGLGIAVKVADGGYRAAGVGLVAVLHALGLLSRGARGALRGYAQPVVHGGGRPVGRVEPAVRLRTRR